jgi:hypothetical protein
LLYIIKKDVDGRDKPGHDEIRRATDLTAQVGNRTLCTIPPSFAP